MTLLADLGHLHLGFPDAQVSAHRQVLEINALRVDVLGKDPGIQGNGAGGTHGVHALFRQKGDLAVPVPGVGVSHDAVAQLQLNFRDGMLLGPFLLTDVDGYHRSQMAHSFIL